MSLFSFKKEAKVYIVHDDIQYNIDISDITFSQTFTEHSYSNKTIQVQNMFEHSIINKANPANFEITFPALRENDLRILFNRALDYGTFDLYITTQQDVFKIIGCVISKAVFIFNRLRPISINISGEGIKLTREGNYGEVSLNGTPLDRSVTRTYNRLSHINVVLDGVSFSDHLNTISLELSNNIKWTPYDTINDAIDAIDASSSMYPQGFIVSNRTLSGTLSRYAIVDAEWGTEISLFMEIGEKVAGIFYGFEIDISQIVFTNRINTGDIFSQNYDWRMTENPNSLLEIISYIGITDSTGAILDSWGVSILDALTDPILESI